jgi:chromate transporter
MLLPPLLILVVELCYLKIAGRAETQGALDGIVLVIVGFNTLLLAKLFLGLGIDLQLVMIAVVSAALALTRKVPAILILFVAAALGYILG